MAEFDFNALNNSGNPVKVSLPAGCNNQKIYVSVNVSISNNQALIMGHTALNYNNNLEDEDVQFQDHYIDWCQNVSGKYLVLIVNVSKTVLGINTVGNVNSPATCTISIELGNQVIKQCVQSDSTKSEPNSIFDFTFQFS